VLDDGDGGEERDTNDGPSGPERERSRALGAVERGRALIPQDAGTGGRSALGGQAEGKRRWWVK